MNVLSTIIDTIGFNITPVEKQNKTNQNQQKHNINTLTVTKKIKIFIL